MLPPLALQSDPLRSLRRGRAVPLPSRRAGRVGDLRRRPSRSGRGRKRLGRAARGGSSPARGDDAAPVRGPQRRAGRHGLPAALPAGARPPRPGPAVRGRRAGDARAAGGAGRAARRAGGRARQEQGAGGRAAGSGAGSRAAGRGEAGPRRAGLREGALPSRPRGRAGAGARERGAGMGTRLRAHIVKVNRAERPRVRAKAATEGGCSRTGSARAEKQEVQK